jgi:hypothetical protein
MHKNLPERKLGILAEFLNKLIFLLIKHLELLIDVQMLEDSVDSESSFLPHLIVLIPTELD